jgi:hypothetical protein
MKPTSTYLNDRATFTYELKIRINSRNYLERIIAFEKAFLVLGEASGLFVAVPFKTEAYLNMEPLLEKYEKERFLSMEQRKTEAVTLLNFEESKAWTCGEQSWKTAFLLPRWIPPTRWSYGQRRR